MNVGIRELKAHLSEYIARARKGEDVIITDRGNPVARLEPLGIEHLPERMQELIRSGRATYKGPLRYLPTPIKMTPGDKNSTDFVREQRGR
jgi:prevent-host-death family protein